MSERSDREKVSNPYKQWEADCLRWRGKVLTGSHRHWCWDWDGLPVDDTTPEWAACTCYEGEGDERAR